MTCNPIPTAFDAFAGDYDDVFTHSTLGRLLRSRVWEKLAEHFTAGRRVLELACGTGEDAVWLAQRGVHITATDGSAEMIRVARYKAEKKGVSELVEARQVSLQQVSEGYLSDRRLAAGSRIGSHRPVPAKTLALEPALDLQPSAFNLQPFDGVYSNFGGLNTIGNWRSLAESLSKIIKPGGKVILVLMGPTCPWEILWYVGHGRPKVAFRRFGGSASAQIRNSVIPVWYPSTRRLRADFSLWFQHLHTESLGLWLPPSYLDHFVDRWPGFFTRLNRFEKATARLTGGWGDHYIIIFQQSKFQE